MNLGTTGLLPDSGPRDVRSFGSGSDGTHSVRVQDQKTLGLELTEATRRPTLCMEGKPLFTVSYLYTDYMYINRDLYPRLTQGATLLRGQAPLGGSCALGPTYHRNSLLLPRPHAGSLPTAGSWWPHGLVWTEENSHMFSK